jgi:hypothetical protein
MELSLNLLRYAAISGKVTWISGTREAVRKTNIVACSVAVFFGALLTGCGVFGAGPWPSVKVDTSGLGDSAMAQVVWKNYTIDPERFLKRAALERIEKVAQGRPLTVAQARELGFVCERDLVSCRWGGALTEQFYANFRQTGRDRYEFSIAIVRENPLDLEVQAKRVEL